MNEKPQSFGDFLKAEFERQQRQHESAHRHLGELRASLKTEVEMATQAGTCPACVISALATTIADKLIELKPDLTKPETMLTAVPEAAHNFENLLLERILERAIEERAKAMVAK